MKEQIDEERSEAGREDVHRTDSMRWVHDSSTDHKGRAPLRASTGVWKAALFIILIEFSERLSYFGIASNLITYLTKVLHQDLKTAATNVNYWVGVTTITPLLGGFLADAYTGCYYMILIESTLYRTGLGLSVMTQFIPTLKPCTKSGSCGQPSKAHEVAFFIGIYIVSLATGGHKPCLQTFGADQFDDHHSEERKQKMSFFNWWNISLCLGLFLGVTVVVYMEDNVGWGIVFLVLTVTMAASTTVFYLGKRCYRYRVPRQGSPLTPMLQVLVAALAKRNLPYPSNPELLHEVPANEKAQRRLLCHTNRLSFLDKAAIIEENETPQDQRAQSSWRLTTVTNVEELKLIICMIPMWLTFLVIGLDLAQASTLFVKQGSNMNRRIFNGFEIPPASISTLTAIGMMMSVAIYDKILLPMLRRAMSNERGISILTRIGIGMIFPTIAMIIAACVETKRLKAAAKSSVKSQEMSVFWLAPQALIVGFGDGFSLVGMQELFYLQVPDSMRSLGMAFYLSVIGFGTFLNSLLIMVVDLLTKKDGANGWIGKDLNDSRLDKFYWLLALINGLNSCIFVVMAWNYSSKSFQKKEVATSSFVIDQENKEDCFIIRPIGNVYFHQKKEKKYFYNLLS